MKTELRILDKNYCFEKSTEVTASTEDPNFPAANLKQFIREKVYRSGGLAEVVRVVFDLKTAVSIDSVALLFSRQDGVKLSDDAVVRLVGNATNSWDEPALSQVLEIDSEYESATHFFSENQTFRYFAFEIEDPDNAYGYVEIAKPVLAKATVLNRSPDSGFKHKLTDQSRISANEYGHEYADTYPSRWAYSFNYNVMEEDDLEKLQSILKRVGKVMPICIALDPGETLFNKDRFFLYGRFSNDFESDHRIYRYFSSGISVVEVM